MCAKKNALWGKILEASGSKLSEEPPARDFTVESGGYGYETAMGRACWPSRDPIGERGGWNLYEMVRNDAVSKADFVGLYDRRNEGIPTTVSNLDQAIDYFRGNYGGTVQATDSVDAEIKGSNSYKDMIKELKETLKKELVTVLCSRTGGTIERAGGVRAVKTGTKTVGSVELNIQPYTISWTGWYKNPSDKDRTVTGTATLDYKYSDEFKFLWDNTRPVVTFFSDTIPSLIAGSGTNFTIEGSFSDFIEIETTQKCCKN